MGGQKSAEGERNVVAFRGPNEGTWIDAATSITVGDAAMRVGCPRTLRRRRPEVAMSSGLCVKR